MTRWTLIASAGLAALTTAACGVNELPAYRSQIREVRFETAIPDTIHLDVAAAPQAVAEDGTPRPPTLDEAWMAEDEGWILDRLAERLSWEISLDALATRFDHASRHDLSRAMPEWDVLTPTQATRGYDTRMNVHLEQLSVEIAPDGFATLRFWMQMDAYHVPAGKRIYLDWRSYEAPLTPAMPMWLGSGLADPLLEARYWNLVFLDDLTPTMLREAISRAAEHAATEAVGELVDDTWTR